MTRLPLRIGALTLVALITWACGDDSAAAPDEGELLDAVASDVAPAEAEVLPGTGVVVTPGRANWSAGYFQAAVYAALLEELGYTVDDPAANEYPPSEAYAVMARGGIDFWANGWYPQHTTWHQEELPDGSLVGDHLRVVGSQLDGAGLQGLVVTKSVADELGVTSLAQIDADPELAAAFDIDGNGLADVLGCPESWTCDNVIDEMIEFNGWTNIEQTKAEYPGLVAEAIDRIEAGLPTIVYTWSPSGHLARLRPGDNVMWLSVGDQRNVLDGSTASGLDYAQYGPAALGDTCTADPCYPGWLVEDVLVTVNEDFAAAHPAALALFEAVELEVADVAEQNALFDAGENTAADLRRHAAEWIERHRDEVDQWLAAALAAGR